MSHSEYLTSLLTPLLQKLIFILYILGFTVNFIDGTQLSWASSTPPVILRVWEENCEGDVQC